MKGFLNLKKDIQLDHHGLFNEEWVQYTSVGSKLPTVQKYGDSNLPPINSRRGRGSELLTIDDSIDKPRMVLKTEESRGISMASVVN